MIAHDSWWSNECGSFNRLLSTIINYHARFDQGSRELCVPCMYKDKHKTEDIFFSVDAFVSLCRYTRNQRMTTFINLLKHTPRLKVLSFIRTVQAFQLFYGTTY